MNVAQSINLNGELQRIVTALEQCPSSEHREEALRAVTAIEEAISKPQQHPVAYLHCDQDISTEQWNALVEGMSPMAAGRVANWLAHGMKCIRKPDGVRMERKDYARRGVCLFIDLNGEPKELPLIASSSQCLIWHRRWNHNDEIHLGETPPHGEKWKPFYPR